MLQQFFNLFLLAYSNVYLIFSHKKMIQHGIKNRQMNKNDDILYSFGTVYGFHFWNFLHWLSHFSLTLIFPNSLLICACICSLLWEMYEFYINTQWLSGEYKDIFCNLFGIVCGKIIAHNIKNPKVLFYIISWATFGFFTIVWIFYNYTQGNKIYYRFWFINWGQLLCIVMIYSVFTELLVITTNNTYLYIGDPVKKF